MKEALWIMIWSFGWIPFFALGIRIENLKRKKRKSNDKIKRSRRDFDNSITATGERIKREIALDRILKSEIRKTVNPIRKVYGVLASPEAQRLLEY